MNLLGIEIPCLQIQLRPGRDVAHDQERVEVPALRDGRGLPRHQIDAQHRRLHDWRARRQAAWLASETYAWRQLQRAWRHTPLPLAPLYTWLQRSGGSANLRELGQQLPTAAGQALQQALAASYGAQQPHATTQQLRNSLPALRRALRKHVRRKAPALRPLNPTPTPRPQA